MDRMEVSLKIVLDRAGVGRRHEAPLESHSAFFILGLVHALLTDKYGDQNCTVEMESATGLSQEFVKSMNTFASRHKAALNALAHDGEVYIRDADLLEVFQVLHDVVVTQAGQGWWVVSNRMIN